MQQNTNELYECGLFPKCLIRLARLPIITGDDDTQHDVLCTMT